jgi:uncharacterized protein
MVKQRSIALCVGGLLTFALISVAMAGPLEDADAAAGRGDYGAVIQILRPLAEQGDARAQVKLGLMYADGRGVPQDYVEAQSWYMKAAANDDPQAEFNLGVLHARGRGVPKDYAEAGKWFQKAADHGDAAAQFNLGVMYAHGLGVSQDYVLARMWFGLSAAQGEEGAAEARDEAAAKMAPAEIAAAERLAREWKSK